MPFVALLSCMLLALPGQQRDARPAQQPSAGSATLRGVVTAIDTGRPTRRVNVTLSGGDPRVVRTMETDELGVFAFEQLPAGDFTLTARKPGYLDTSFGQKQPGSGRPGTVIPLTAGQHIKDVGLSLARGAVISGRVLDEIGDPAAAIAVRVSRWVMKSGERTLELGSSAMTDERGMYRIPSLVPGDYVVSLSSSLASTQPFAFKVEGELTMAVSLDTLNLIADAGEFRTRSEPPPPAVRRGFIPQFYPGVRQAASAERVTLGPGEERAGVDFTLQIGSLTRVTGVVTSPTGPVRGAAVRVVEAGQPAGYGVRTVRTDATGKFTITGLPPGQYRLTTRSAPKGGPQLEAGAREAVEFLAKAPDAAKAAQIGAAINAAVSMWAAADISVDGRDVSDVTLSLEPGVTFSGKIAAEAGATLPVLSRVTIALTAVGAGEDGVIGPAAIDAAGRFTIRGVVPGRYRPVIMGGLPSGWSIATAVFNGLDIADEPLTLADGAGSIDGVITLTNQTTEVAGAVTDASGQPAPGVTVIAFPAEDRLWSPDSRRIQAVRPTTSGRYQIRGLPPGAYRLVAVPDVEPGRWFDPEFLRELRGFVNISLQAGGKTAQDFRVQ